MKHFKLTAWPDLQSAYQRTAYRRMLCDMSHRYVSLQHLVAVSGLPKTEVRQFIELLDSKGLVAERESPQADSIFDTLRPLSTWIFNALTTEIGGSRRH
jgi:hypothetical protein